MAAAFEWATTGSTSHATTAQKDSRAIGPRQSTQITTSDVRSELYRELDKSITWPAILQYPLYIHRMDEWFEKYVYTPRVMACISKLRPAQAYWATLPSYTSLGLDFGIIVTASKGSAPLTSLTPKLLRVFSKFLTILLEHAIRRGAPFVVRLGLKGAISLVPYVGWVVGPTLLALDGYLASQLVDDFFRFRPKLVEAIVDAMMGEEH